VKHICLYCSTEFRGRGYRKFCNQSCANKYHRHYNGYTVEHWSLSRLKKINNPGGAA